MRLGILAALALALLANPAFADQPKERHQHSLEEMEAAHAAVSDLIEVKPNQGVIQVNGIVCSFCAHGVEKSLKKVEAIDKSQFGGDGVFVDIENHRVTIALLPGKAFPAEEIFKRIRKAGYDPVRFFVDTDGTTREVIVDAAP